MISNSVLETERIASEYAAGLKAGDVLFFRGDLGAGKTAFVRGLAAGLGIPPETVSSPTFTFVKEYVGGRLPLAHFDMYRVGSADDLYSIGFFDYLETDAVIAVEWSENIEAFADVPHVTVTISRGESEDQRIITIEGVHNADSCV
ncbi:MAG: tRNA (adenosine(37)-N6)-threonylcarbamoyltransferase complex ATPase subunit type 1 TsaE [Clostridia bacterium]|nr:tRNA (adenosine(37)-N6)-threonylcarbamoyltransferase complex ATPase subunit type 1 TsaE [Clostridia bacterium]